MPDGSSHATVPNFPLLIRFMKHFLKNPIKRENRLDEEACSIGTQGLLEAQKISRFPLEGKMSKTSVWGNLMKPLSDICCRRGSLASLWALARCLDYASACTHVLTHRPLS